MTNSVKETIKSYDNNWIELESINKKKQKEINYYKKVNIKSISINK